MVLALPVLVAGVALLAYAADQFVLGAARVALLGRIPPLLVGVVIVGFGTSAPELLVSAIAAARGDAEVAIGNIVGSNIANLSLLLGVGALIVPISVASRTVRREVPITVFAIAVFAVAVQGGLHVLEGVGLLLGLAVALWVVSRGARGDGATDPLGPETEELADVSHHRWGREVLRTLLGLVGTVAGAQCLLWAAVDIADRAGLGRGFVGATLVAVGTSLPELVTVVQSARRRETDLIVGNLLGSNLFNALGVGGLAGVIGTESIDDRTLTVLGASAAVVVALLASLAMRTRRTVDRREGIALIVVYAVIVPLLL